MSLDERMREIIIKSVKVKGLQLQILNNEFSILEDAEEKDKKGLIAETSIYAYELFQLLKKADDLGVFAQFKTASDSDSTVIYV